MATVETLAVDMQYMKSAIENQAATLKAINESLQVLAKLQASHDMFFEQLKTGAVTMSNHNSRITELEKSMPPLLEVRKWVVGGVIATVGLVGTAAFKVLFTQELKSAQTNQPQFIYVQPAQQSKPKDTP